MSASLYIFSICLLPATVLVVFAMRYVSTVLQARARLANEGAYRQIAERAAASQSETAAALTSIQTTLADVRTRLAAVEKILKDVE